MLRFLSYFCTTVGASPLSIYLLKTVDFKAISDGNLDLHKRIAILGEV